LIRSAGAVYPASTQTTNERNENRQPETTGWHGLTPAGESSGGIQPASWRACRQTLCCAHMTIQRMDNVLIVVEDLEAAKAFFVELGMELEGETQVEGAWAGRVVGLDDVRADIAMMRTPDGHGRVELSKFHTPPAVRAEPENAPANALGIRRIMFAVDDIDDVVARLRNHGAELVDEIAQYEDIYRLCFLRGPEGIIIGLAEKLG
jgi:catechol 2,3-dioxygenase-like lactoylglutathione lyase family enzyme